MRAFLTDLFSTTDNKGFELARVLMAVAMLSLIGAQIYALYKGAGQFDATNFGIGAATILGGGSAGIAVKDRARSADTSVSADPEPTP